MRSIKSLACLLAVGAMLSITVDRCEAEDGWSLNKLWPGGKETTRRSSTRRLPTEMFRTASRNRSKSDSSSMFDRITAGPKSVWEKTKDLVTSDSDKKRTTATAPRRRQEKTSALSRLFGLGKSTSRRRRITDVNDFLRLERPDY